MRFFLVNLFLLSLSAFSSGYKIELTTNKADAIYTFDEEIIFSAKVSTTEKSLEGMKLNYVLRGDGDLQETGSFTSFDNACEVSTSLSFPGWVYIRFTLHNADGSPVKTIAANKREINLFAEIGAMIEPFKIKAALEEPEDFDAFWAAARKELDEVPIKVKKEKFELPDAQKDKLQCWDIKIDCAGGMPVSGYLVMPLNAEKGSLPIVVSYHGAGVRSANRPLHWATKGAICLDINAHGIENGEAAEFYAKLANNELKGYPHFNKNDPQKFYFRGMYMRVMRSLDYVKSLPEWDGKNLIVTGGSQGGAQAIVAAGLDEQVTICLSAVPALSEHSGVLAKPKRQAGWPRLYNANKDGKAKDENVCKTAAYFDNVYFAKRIKAETYISAGFVDLVCVPTGILATFNNLPQGIKKEISLVPNGNHGSTGNRKGNQRINKFFEK